MSERTEQFLDTLLAGRATTIARDLKLNLKKLLFEGSLNKEEAFLGLLATSTATEHLQLAAHARQELAALGVAADQIEEAAESAAIMAMLNLYYRFRYMVDKDDDYHMTGLRMTGLARPAMGKERFEMLAFAVSVINGCQSCVRSHEKVLRDAGISADKVHDLARLAAVVKGLQTLHTIQ